MDSSGPGCAQCGAASTALVLSGGGARAAYQVGALAAIGDLLGDAQANPFHIIVGTSAGAINAVALASGIQQFRASTLRLRQIWQGFTTERVYRSDLPGVLHQAMCFVGGSLFGMRRDIPVALLDNAPLADLLREEVHIEGVGPALASGHLRALAVSAFGYRSAHAVTFYQTSAPIIPWRRHRRVGIPIELTCDHLMASAAIPLLFPPVPLDGEYYGDGAVRQNAPISPALHLGARRVMVIGVSGISASSLPEPGLIDYEPGNPPSLAQMGGHLLNSTFIDSLEQDLELLERMNQLSELIPEERRSDRLQPVDVMVVAPSRPLDEIAARHRRLLPRALRLFLHGPGATRASGAGVLSYLLFEAGYCNELIELGYQDVMNRRSELEAFLGPALVQPKRPLR